MKKREFLAMGGAVPLILAGCGGKGAGNAPVRLVNASIGYPNLGFIVNTTQATSTDVPYGSASPFETVEAGTVSMALTETTSGSTVVDLSPVTRSLSKDSRYTLVAYGYVDELKSVLITETTTTPDSGFANVNILNTSVDVGAVDVYLLPSTATALSQATRIAVNVNPGTTGIVQTSYTGVLVGSYTIIVAGTGTSLVTNPDIRLQSTVPFTLANEISYTVVLSPAGLSGTLANAIIITQGSGGTVTPELNLTARVRAVVSATANATTTHNVVVTGTLGSTSVPILSTTTPNLSDYVIVSSGTLPTVQVDGATLVVTSTVTPITLAAGGDYTLLVYLGAGGVPTAQLLPVDDNTAPTTSGNVKIRLINLVYDSSDTLPLTLAVNSTNVGSNVAFAAVPVYKEITPPTQLQSTIDVRYGALTLTSLRQTTALTPNKIYTDFVVGYADAADVTAIAQGTATSAQQANVSISSVFEASSTD